MKKSHKWIPMIEVRCPHCGRLRRYYGEGFVGWYLECPACGSKFQLGRQK